jgi:hypothetical protein
VADLDANTAILIAVITALSVVVGGLITSGINYLIEWQKSKREAEREAVKFKQENEIREIELRNKAYIKFLSLTPEKISRVDDQGNLVVDLDLATESVALVITYGSPPITGMMVRAYPFKSWDDLERARKFVIAEFWQEKGPEGADEAYEKCANSFPVKTKP